MAWFCVEADTPLPTARWVRNALDLRCPHVAGVSLVVMQYEAADPVHVRLLRPDAIVLPPDPVPDLVQQTGLSVTHIDLRRCACFPALGGIKHLGAVLAAQVSMTSIALSTPVVPAWLAIATRLFLGVIIGPFFALSAIHSARSSYSASIEYAVLITKSLWARSPMFEPTSLAASILALLPDAVGAAVAWSIYRLVHGNKGEQ